jgi:hypothetical protein
VARSRFERARSGQIQQAANGVHRHVELLLTHPLALDVAQALGPAVAVGVELTPHRAHAAPGERVEVVAEAVVTCPAPEQRDRARKLHGLVGVALVRVGAEVDGAVADHLMHDLAAAGVVDPLTSRNALR